MICQGLCRTRCLIHVFVIDFMDDTLSFVRLAGVVTVAALVLLFTIIIMLLCRFK